MIYRKTILAVEHTPMVRSGIAAALANEYCEVVECASSGVALDVLKLVRVDLVVSEFEMPDLDGVELTRRIRALPMLEAVPIVLLACASGAAIQNRAVRAGASAWLPRPVTKERLQETVARLLHADGHETRKRATRRVRS